MDALLTLAAVLGLAALGSESALQTTFKSQELSRRASLLTVRF
jgi:hypothetical protein